MELPINQIIQGDCLEVMKTFPGDSIDLILTDPPYNTGMKATNRGARLHDFFDDDYTDEDYLKLVRGGAYEMFRILKNDKPIYLFINWKQLGLWLQELRGVGFNIKNTIVWDKVVHGLNYQNYANTHEFIIYGVKGNWFPTNKESQDKKRGFFKDVWSIQRKMTDNDGHETIKAEEVLATVLSHAPNEKIVCDPFMGSGSTAFVCKRMGRDYVGCEMEQKYIDIANKRLRQEVLL
jgi:DNA modification methylase